MQQTRDDGYTECNRLVTMDPLNATDSSLCTRRLSNLACLTHIHVRVPSFPFVQFLVYGHTQTDRQTYTRVLQCSHASVGLAQARPNNISAFLSIVQNIRLSRIADPVNSTMMMIEVL